MESGQRIASLHRIHVNEAFYWFSATSRSDTLVAMSYPETEYHPNADNSVRLHLLRGDRLEELTRIQLTNQYYLLWLADRLLVSNYDEVIELEVIDTRLGRRRELIATSEYIHVSRLIAVNDELAIVDQNNNILLYLFV